MNDYNKCPNGCEDSIVKLVGERLNPGGGSTAQFKCFDCMAEWEVEF